MEITKDTEKRLEGNMAKIEISLDGSINGDFSVSLHFSVSCNFSTVASIILMVKGGKAHF